MTLFTLSDEEFRLISGLVHAKFGIRLTEKKRSLIVGRLQRLLLAGGFKSFKDYYEYVITEPTGKALLEMIDRISTNHTYFFREKAHFDFLANEALPLLLRSFAQTGHDEIRIWCAGCSTGEEPYSAAMVLHDCTSALQLEVGVAILATDISLSALEKACTGVYGEESLQHVPPPYRLRYFMPLGGGKWAVVPEIKEMVLFRRLNLMRPEYPFRSRFHIIFCRNVMIYFDLPTQRALVERFYHCTEPGGYLFVGHSETLGRFAGPFRYIKPSVYQKD